MSDVHWIDEQRLEVRGTRFIATAVPLTVDADQFVIVKTPELVRDYLALIERERPRRIVELGIKDGGSTALLALVAEPERLLAIDLEDEIPPLLAKTIATQRLEDSLVPVFGIDQGDRAVVMGLVEQYLPGELDLVIDDASHILDPTLVSFEMLFPRLRPGGLYVIEDWSAGMFAAGSLWREIPDAPDFAERLAVVNHLMDILNAPDQEIPAEVLAELTRAAEGVERDGATLFELIVRAAARADLSALGAGPAMRPLADLGVALMMAAATSRGVIEQVTSNDSWITVRRGPEPLPAGFSLAGLWRDYFGYLT